MRIRSVIIPSVSLLVLLMLSVSTAGAATYTLTVKTNASSYSGAQTLIASGAVSPAPGAGTAVFLKIIGPSGGTPLAVGQASVDGTSGSYQTSFVLGGSSGWVAGTYTLAASWGNSLSGAVNATTTFTYTPTTTTTTTTTSTTTTTTTTTSTTPSTTTTTATTTTSTTTTTPTITTTTTTATTSQVQIPPNAVRVSILSGASANTNSPGYSPATITVVIGVNNTVAWTNNDVTIHTVTANDKSFNSGDIAPGSSFLQTFTTPGVYSYRCVYHSWMSGTVTVKAAAVTTTTSTSSSTSTSTPTSSTTSTSQTASSTFTSSATSTSSSSGGIPEFPFQFVGVSLFTVLVIASYLLARRRRELGGLIGRSSE